MQGDHFLIALHYFTALLSGSERSAGGYKRAPSVAQASQIKIVETDEIRYRL